MEEKIKSEVIRMMAEGKTEFRSKDSESAREIRLLDRAENPEVYISYGVRGERNNTEMNVDALIAAHMPGSLGEDSGAQAVIGIGNVPDQVQLLAGILVYAQECGILWDAMELFQIHQMRDL